MCLFVGQHFVSHFGGKSQLETCGKKVGNQQQIHKKKEGSKNKITERPRNSWPKTRWQAYCQLFKCCNFGLLCSRNV